MQVTWRAEFQFGEFQFGEFVGSLHNKFCISLELLEEGNVVNLKGEIHKTEAEH
jgi:hypothetical protein